MSQHSHCQLTKAMNSISVSYLANDIMHNYNYNNLKEHITSAVFLVLHEMNALQLSSVDACMLYTKRNGHTASYIADHSAINL